MELSPVTFSCWVLFMFLVPQLITSTTSPTSGRDDIGFRIDLTHVDAARDFTPSERIRRAAQQSKNRRAAPKPGTRTVPPVHVYPGSGEYLIEFAIGTPPLTISGVLDTGSDLVWTQCKGCNPCLYQPTPFYDLMESKTFRTLPCSDKLCMQMTSAQCTPDCFADYSYGDRTRVRGPFGTEIFTFGTTKKVRIPLSFACGLINAGDLNNSTGVIGFGRGPLSLVSQLGATRFSYCMADNSAPLFFGPLAKLTGTDKIQTTPLKSYPLPATPSFYYVNLTGITVGATLLPIPPAVFSVIDKDGNGGTIVDSGTGYLLLHEKAFDQVVKAFKSQVKLPYVNASSLVGLELCFKNKKADVVWPKFILHLEGADLDLPTENYIGSDSENGLNCALIQNGGTMSIIANTNTENMHVLYDLKNNLVSFQPAKCDQL